MSNKTELTTNCILCGHETHLFDGPLHITYLHCPHCELIFKHEDFLPTKQSEQERYEEHNNDEENQGYIQYMDAFIQRNIIPLNGIKTILDFGSGPYPMLTKRLQLHDYQVTHYDPFFYDDKSYLSKSYDLIILVEVLEHIFQPQSILQQLMPILRPGGYLLIQTEFRTMTITEFTTWWYRRDKTHIAFYNLDTIRYLSDALSLKIVSTNNTNTILFQK